MSGQSRSTLFLIEKLIVIAVFAICASACAGIFVESYLNANLARDTSYALSVAKNAAEQYKAYKNLSDTAVYLGGQAYGAGTEETAFVYYDSDWQVSPEEGAAYVLHFRRFESTTKPPQCILSVDRMTGEGLLSFTVAVRSSD